jgi:multidrug efflux pump subunit AcrA (membrane-fusion protein)
VLPGNAQAFIDSPIYARTNGYLKRWYVDIGARGLAKGQLLAEIETPELDQQLRQAQAELATAEANLNLSQITAARDENLLKTTFGLHSRAGQRRKRLRRQPGNGSVEPGECRTARTAAIFREGVRAL